MPYLADSGLVENEVLRGRLRACMCHEALTVYANPGTDTGGRRKALAQAVLANPDFYLGQFLAAVTAGATPANPLNTDPLLLGSVRAVWNALAGA